MTILSAVLYIQCNGCEEKIEHQYSGTGALQSDRPKDWAYKNGEHVCPDCIKLAEDAAQMVEVVKRIKGTI